VLAGLPAPFTRVDIVGSPQNGSASTNQISGLQPSGKRLASLRY